MPKKKLSVPGYISPSLASLVRPIGDLTQDPRNVNQHNQRNLDAIAASLRKFGQQKPIVALPDGTVMAGNGLLKVAGSLGWTHIAVATFHGDTDDPAALERMAQAFGVADNRTSDLSEFDDEALAALMQEITANGEFDVADMGFSDEEFAGLVADLENETAASERAGDYSGDSGAYVPAEDEQDPGAPSSVRMVQLFLDEHTHPQFMEKIRDMGKEWGTPDITSTVWRAVMNEPFPS